MCWWEKKKVHLEAQVEMAKGKGEAPEELGLPALQTYW